jgi:hypothetical protein
MSMDPRSDSPRFFSPGGREISPVPEPADASAAPALPRSSPDINLCHWDGEPVDHDEAVDAMCAAST